MKPFPDNTKDLPSYDETCEAIEKFIKTRWNGIKNFKPKGWDAFKKDYTDFGGMQEYCDSGQDEKDADDFEGLNISKGGGSGFTSRVALPYVMYDAVCQGRSPLQVFIGSILSYGMQKGVLYGKEDAKNEIISDITYKMYGKVFDSDLDDKTKLDVIEMFRSCAAEKL